MTPANSPNLARVPLIGKWYRAVRQHHFATALAYQHSTTSLGRFNPGTPQKPGFPVLYFAENQQVALFEVLALLGSPLPGHSVVPNPQAGPWTVFDVTIRLAWVVDLCDPAQLQIINTSVQELTGDWRGYSVRNPVGHPQTAPTQQLGSALFHRRVRVEGLLTYSAKDPVRRNLVVFPTRLRQGSLIELIDPNTGRGQRITAGGVLADIP